MWIAEICHDDESHSVEARVSNENLHSFQVTFEVCIDALSESKSLP